VSDAFYEVMERLNRWTVYMHWLSRGGGSLPGPAYVRSWWVKLVLEDNVQGRGRLARNDPPCPVNALESGKTTLCVRALPTDLREVIIQAFLEGGTVQQQAHAVGCSIGSYYRKKEDAYCLLFGLFNDVEMGVPLAVA
jgi:hypothetical protein